MFFGFVWPLMPHWLSYSLMVVFGLAVLSGVILRAYNEIQYRKF